jgi:hypothetical protein
LPDSLQALLKTLERANKLVTRKPQGRRAWLEHVFAGPDERAKQKAALVRSFGQPSERVNGREVYRSFRDGSTAEVVVEEATGLIVEHKVVRDGKQNAHTVYGYRETSPGVFMRVSARVELAATRPGVMPMVIDRRVDNVRLERRGGSH